MVEFSDKCACCGGNLDRFLQPVILSILARGELGGYAIVKQIATYSTFRGNGPDPTGVYRYLKIMCAKGMLEKDDETEKSLYRLTEHGKACLAQWVGTLEDYARQIDELRGELSAQVQP